MLFVSVTNWFIFAYTKKRLLFDSLFCIKNLKIIEVDTP